MSATPTATASNESPQSPRDEMRVVFARVAETCDLPPLPAVALRAMNLARDPEATAEALAKVVSMDAPLAARVLRMAGSAVYARRTPPKSVIEAITTVGFDNLRKVLVAASARTVFAGRDLTAESLWAHALATAMAADELAVRDGHRRGGSSFMAGLLHDVGKLVFHVANPAAFRDLGRCDLARETDIFGVSHAAVGGCLAEQWGLDDEIVEGVMFHHAGAMSPLAERLDRADRIAHQIGYGSTSAADHAVEVEEDPALADVGGTVLESIEREAAFFA